MSKEIWDYHDALSRTLSSDDILAEVITSYIDDTQTVFNQLVDAIESRDLENIRFHAHTLKGTAANIGAPSFSDHAKQIEFAVKDNLIEQLEPLLAQLKQSKLVLFEQLSCFLNDRSQPEK